MYVYENKRFLPVSGLETRMQRRQKWMICRQSEYPFFRHGTIHVIVLYNDVFFQNFDRVHFVGVFLFGQHHFTETTFAQYFDEMEVV